MSPFVSSPPTVDVQPGPDLKPGDMVACELEGGIVRLAAQGEGVGPRIATLPASWRPNLAPEWFATNSHWPA